ncbi:hypothetical protein VTI74DRAFT_7856 [Chaetomium olivicolor]
MTSCPATTTAPIPTPTYGHGGSFSIRCSPCHIAATPQACLDAVVTAADYPSWNRFCRRCTIDAQPPDCKDDPSRLQLGTRFTFDVHLDPDEPDAAPPGQVVALEVSVLEAIDDDDDHNDDGGDEAAAVPDSSRPRRRKGWRIAWKPRQTSVFMPGWMLRSERVQQFVEVEAGTEYECYETFYGVLAPVLWMAVSKKVERGFEAWAEGLKGWVEGRKQGRTA